MNEQDEAERENIEEKLEKLKKIAKIFFRSEIEGIIWGEALLNEVWERHFNDMDSNLWTPYSNWVEKVRNIEIGDDENDREGIDKKELNEFKEKMIKAIREKGVQLKAEKIAKANSDLEKAKLKAIQTIEKELKDRGLKIEDLEEEYHNYKEAINGLSKKFKIRSYEDKVMEAIRQKSQGGRFKAKQGDFSWQEQSEKLDKDAEKLKDADLPDEQKIDKEMELMEREKLHDGKLKKTDDVGGDEESRKKLQILLDEIKKKENKGQNSQQDKNETLNPRTIKKVTLAEGENLLVEFEKDGKLETQFINSEEIVKNQELQKIKEFMLKENKRSINYWQGSTVNSVEPQTEAKSNKNSLLIVGGLIFVVSLAFALGYWLNWLNRKDTKKDK